MSLVSNTFSIVIDICLKPESSCCLDSKCNLSIFPYTLALQLNLYFMGLTRVFVPTRRHFCHGDAVKMMIWLHQ